MSQALNAQKKTITIVKLGGNVIDDSVALAQVLDHFSKVEGDKILVHGGGKLATELATKLNVPQTMVEGRRVTDAETLKIATMVYAGLINKTIVAQLYARGVSALGVTGADGDFIRSVKRGTGHVSNPALPVVDYGFVGDVTQVNGSRLIEWLKEGLTPVIAPITHDGLGQLLNTNADTIANEVAKAVAQVAGSDSLVTLIYSFEKKGVLLNVEDESSLILEINPDEFIRLKKEDKIFAGMIPKLDNAFQAIGSGVNRVILGKAQELPLLLLGKSGTRIVGSTAVHSGEKK